MVPLSILDLATVATGSTPARALAETTRLAGVAERLGWLSFICQGEGHGIEFPLASSASLEYSTTA